MRLAYADPPYPGKAHLYPENTEVDHSELIERLRKYDGWALSTDERSLAYVLPLCPAGVRVLSWCRKNVAPLRPNPVAAWEPVILSPARIQDVVARSYCETGVAVGARQEIALTGQKPPEFCEWIIRCLGADRDDDTLDDFFPGTGVMGQTWEKWRNQRPLWIQPRGKRSGSSLVNEVRRNNTSLPGLEPDRKSVPERRHKRERAA